MKKEEQKPMPASREAGDISKKVNLDDYAGDADDHQQAKDQANNYRQHLDNPTAPTPPGTNEEG